jgi:hypothetical protein
MPTLGGITFKEYFGSGFGIIRRNKPGELTRIFDVDWANGWSFMAILLGQQPTSGAADVQNITYLPTPFAQNIMMWCTECDFKPLGKMGIDPVTSMATYTKMRITAHYGPLNDTDAGGLPTGSAQGAKVWFEESVVFRHTMMMQPGYSAYWLGGGSPPYDPVDFPIGMPTVEADVTIARYGLKPSQVNRTALCAACGKTNYGTFLGYPSATLLFNGFSPKRSVDVYGHYLWDITVSMLFKPYGHNKMWRPGLGWQYVCKANGDPIFENVNFNAL